MSEFLTDDEKKWLRKLDLLLAKAPSTLAGKVSTYTTGDNNITMFDKRKVDAYIESLGFRENHNDERCTEVEKAGSDTRVFRFPFAIESTAG